MNDIKSLFEIKFHQTEEWTKISKKYFERFCYEFANYSTQYLEKLGEFPFVYSERSLTSAVLPSLIKADENNNAFIFMEQPFKITKGEKEIQRFLDFYIDHTDYLYLVEMKHQWYPYKKNGAKPKTIAIWKKCLEQIGDLDKTTIKEHICDLSVYKDSSRVAMLIMPVYGELNSKEASDEKAEEYCQTIKTEFDKLKDMKIPNFIAVWKIKDYKREFDDDDFQSIPYVIFALYKEKI